MRECRFVLVCSVGTHYCEKRAGHKGLHRGVVSWGVFKLRLLRASNKSANLRKKCVEKAENVRRKG